MRPALKLVFLWLILAGVNLGGLRQATSASWGRPGGKSLVALSRSCSSEDPNRQHAPTLRLLERRCASSPSSDQHIKARPRPVAHIPIPILRRAVGTPARTVLDPLDPGQSKLAWSTGPPVYR